MNFNNSNWDTLEVGGGEFKKPGAGGYVVRILGVRDDAPKSKLIVTFDIVEGEFANYYSDEWGQRNTWAHEFFVSYKDSALGLFKQFVTILEEDNGFTWDGSNESMFIGRLMGLVLKEEEYVGNDGNVKTRFSKLATYKHVEQIRQGDFKVPETKKVERQGVAALNDAFGMANDNIPF